MAARFVGLGSTLAITLLFGCSDHHDAKPAEDPFGNAPKDGDGDKSGSDGAGSGDDGFDNVPDAGGGPQGAGSSADDGSGNGNGGSGSSPSTTLPVFPGAGTSNAGDPLPNGMLCDAVAGADSPIPEPIEQCFYDKDDPTNMVPAATLEQVLECVEETDTVHIRLTFHPWFVDNTYGENSVGWHTGTVGNGKPRKGGHSFNDLVDSDHAEIILNDASGAAVMQFKLDYLSADANRPSGYGSLGVLGGEGAMILGDASDVVRWMTSEDLNLNERGYASYTSESPATDMDYTPNAATPEWDYRVVYEAWIDISIFGSAGFGGAHIEYVHASPSKADGNTVEVVPGDCPCSDPDGCVPPPPPPPGSCGSNDPDEVCADAGVPPPDNGGEPVPVPVM